MAHETLMHKRPGTLLIACGALAREIAALRRANGWTTLDVRCLPAQLHNRPERIAPAVRAEIQANRAHYENMFVVYGDCGTRGELDAVLKSPEVSSRLAKDGVIAVGGTSEAFMAAIRAEVKRWQDFIQRTGLKLD